ncbi:MAG: hypothetical protein WBB94_02195 [Candidatus Saccharimonadaceae bacterium]
MQRSIRSEHCPPVCLARRLQDVERAGNDGSRARLCPLLALAAMDPLVLEGHENIGKFFMNVLTPQCAEAMNASGHMIVSQIVSGQEATRAYRVAAGLILEGETVPATVTHLDVRIEHVEHAAA